MLRAHRASPLRPSRNCAVIIVTILICLFLVTQKISDHTRPPLSFSSRHVHSRAAPVSGTDSWHDTLGVDVLDDSSALEYGEDGKVRGWDKIQIAQEHVKRGTKALGSGFFGDHEVKPIHPIEALIRRGEQRWNTLIRRQSKTLKAAVKEYKRRYGRSPPRGFEKWYQFCRDNDVKIIDDYDQIDKDVSLYWALSPETFRARTNKLFDADHTFHIHLPRNGDTKITGTRAESARGKLLYRLLTPLAELLPADLVIHCSDHDMGSWLLPDDQRKVLQTAIDNKEYVTEEQLKPYEKRVNRVAVQGLVSACPEDSLGWIRGQQKLDGVVPADLTDHETTFIHNPQATFDFCSNPALLQSHGAFSFDYPREPSLRPIFQLSKFSRNQELLTTPLEAFHNITERVTQNGFSDSDTGEAAPDKNGAGGRNFKSEYVRWDDKKINKLFWRGSSTGDSYRKEHDWRQSHRPKLHLMAQAERGTESIWVERDGVWEKEQWGVKNLNDRYMDVGLAGKPHQCRNDDGTCDEMAAEIKFKDRVRPENTLSYKYMIDVDGNGWSSRFHRLLTSGSVVIKATIYPEWNSDWLIPWYHYIPAQVDYSDLYSILSFFIGSPDGAPDSGHDDLAKRIAFNARHFTEEYWRWEDMQAYMFRLLLEYARLEADDRDTFWWQS